jgi:hypothetical protein
VKDRSFDADTAERMLRGESTGPRILTELLTAATSEPTTENLSGEETAVAAFREARSLASRRPRRLSALFSLKAALIGLLLLLAGGVTAAAAAQHLPGPLGNRHSHGTPTPTVSRTVETHTPRRSPSPPTPDQPDKQDERPADHAHAGTPRATHHPAPPTRPTHPTKPTAAHPKNSHIPPGRR